MERKTFVVDANIFLELLLDQDQAEACAQLLQFLEDKGHTIVIVLRYGRASFLSNFY